MKFCCLECKVAISFLFLKCRETIKLCVTEIPKLYILNVNIIL